MGATARRNRRRLCSGKSGGVPTDRSVNQVLVASDAPIGELDVAAADGVVVDGAELDAYVGDARVLTDDHAPVDQLLLR